MWLFERRRGRGGKTPGGERDTWYFVCRLDYLLGMYIELELKLVRVFFQVVNRARQLRGCEGEERERSTRLHKDSSDNFLKSASSRLRSLRYLDFPKTSAPSGEASGFRV